MNLRQKIQPAGWPESLNDQIEGLPRRWLLRTERVGVVLAGLRARQRWVFGPLPEECLLAVTFGEGFLPLGSEERRLSEGESMVLAPGRRHQLQAGEEPLDFLLMNLAVRGAGGWRFPGEQLRTGSHFRQPAGFQFDYAHLLS